ncbi:MAG: DUF4391 domain-containing protein [bacterium]|nr:DUF4391 domain-containing protein [bacterium]
MLELHLHQKAFINKFIAKSKFYEKASLSSKLQSDFTSKIQKITWKYKLAEDTIGISKTDKVTEIQIFEIELKEQTIPKNILKIIDKAIPYQILYIFSYKDKFAYGITLKENNVAQNYYFSEWNTTPQFDFTGIDLEKVYQKLIKSFITNEAKNETDFKTSIDLDQQIKNLEKEIEALNNKIKKEKQFNLKVDMNKSLLKKTKQLQCIKETKE